MKKTVIFICIAFILCVSICMAAVHLTENNDVPEINVSESVATDITYNTTGDISAETIATTTATTPNVDLVEDLSASRGYGLSLVQIDKKSPLYAEPVYEREGAESERTLTLFGRILTVRYIETIQFAGYELQDTYEDEYGDTYDFAEDGTFLSYISESALSSFSGAQYTDKGIAPDISENEAIEIAEKVGKETFGEAFDKLKLESVKYKDGIYDVYYYQRLGADGSILGLRYYASILADGRIFSFGMPGAADLRDLDESKYELVTKSDIEREIAVNAAKVFGENKVDFPVNEIMEIGKINGKFAFCAMVETRSGGADIYYEVTD